jgi:uncharacterized surface protein with fasciclin (FAS1) repeats
MKKSKHTRCQLAIARNRLWILLPVLLLLFSACRDDTYFDRDPEKGTTVEQYLKANPNYSRFVEALENTGVMVNIGSSGIWTLFVPNNSAMEGVNVNPQTKEERDVLVRRLNYHVGLGLEYTERITDNKRLLTRTGKFLSLMEDPYQVNNVEFGSLNPNQSVFNAVIHEVNTFMVPQPNVVEAAQATANLSLLAAALERFRDDVFDPRLSVDFNNDGIVDDSVFTPTYVLSNIDLARESERMTVFAPTNAAMEAYLAEQGLTSLNQVSDADLKKLLDKHVVKAYKPSNTLTEGEILTATDGSKFAFDPSIVVQADVLVSNGVVHVINKVLTH